MVFASPEFLGLFLPLFLALTLVSPRAWHNAILLAGSCVFYAWWSPWFLWLLAANTVCAWAGALAIEAAASERARGRWLATLIALNLATLAGFKYANLGMETLNATFGLAGAPPLAWERVVLPIGLSFYVLQAISYLVDVWRREVRAERSFVDFAAYHAMFGQLIAGPIVRYAWVARDIHERVISGAGFAHGARRFMIGVSMKVLVADTLAPVVDLAFSLPQPSLFDAWAGCLAYCLQLFFDFAGYSAMAIGLGLMLGFRLPENFLNPYLARDLQDFWRRWHISLSSWLRDYLYIPLGGSRHGRWRTYRNLALTMALAGLWHGGDTWNYLLWGILHGVALVIVRRRAERGARRLPGWLAHACTLAFLALAFTLFRASGFDAALAMYAGQFGLHGLGPGEAMRLALRPVHGAAALLGVACIVYPLAAPWLRGRLEGRGQRLAGAWPVPAFMLSFALIASRDTVPFLYFQF